MIKDDIMNELQHIPEAKLRELYDIIHYFRLGIRQETEKQIAEADDFKIDESLCLKTLKKIKQGDFSR